MRSSRLRTTAYRPPRHNSLSQWLDALGVVSVTGVVVFGDTKTLRQFSRQQLVLVQQPRLLELLDVGQVTQRVEPELRQESFRGDECVGRPGLRAARTGGDQVQ